MVQELTFYIRANKKRKLALVQVTKVVDGNGGDFVEGINDICISNTVHCKSLGTNEG